VNLILCRSLLKTLNAVTVYEYTYLIPLDEATYSSRIGTTSLPFTEVMNNLGFDSNQNCDQFTYTFPSAFPVVGKLSTSTFGFNLQFNADPAFEIIGKRFSVTDDYATTQVSVDFIYCHSKLASLALPIVVGLLSQDGSSQRHSFQEVLSEL